MRFGQVLAYVLIAMFAVAALGAALDQASKFITGKSSSIVGLYPAIAGVETATPPSTRERQSSSAFRIPRGVAVEMPPVNVRSDGSIRHRQHHPTCFPRC